MKKKEKRPEWTWIVPLVCVILSLFALPSMIFGFLFGWLWSYVGYGMMERRGRDPTGGWILGFLLGLVGLLIICFIRKKK